MSCTMDEQSQKTSPRGQSCRGKPQTLSVVSVLYVMICVRTTYTLPLASYSIGGNMSLLSMQRLKSFVDDTCSLDPHCQWTWVPQENGLRNVTTDEALAMVPENYMYAPGNDSDVGQRGNFLFVYGRPEMGTIQIKSPYYTLGVFENTGCSLSFQMHTNVTFPNKVSVMSRALNYTSMIQDNLENSTPTKWEKKKVLLAKHTRQVVIEIIMTPGSHIGIDDIKLENCLPDDINGIPQNGSCPTDTHFLCSDNATCIPHHRVCDISPDCPDEGDETEKCLRVPLESRCTFESGFCGWQNSSEEMMLSWKLNKGDRQKFTGPKWDNTYQNRSGTYAYVDMSGPAHLGSAARMESAHFHPPPPYCSNPESKYYNSCYISFFYHKFGSHSGSLGLYLVETHGEVDRMQRLWWSFGNYGNTWLRTVVYLKNITTSYYLQFEARKFMSQKGDVAIDDIAMSPKCFGLDVPKEELKGYKYETAGVNDTNTYNVTPLKIPVHPDFINKTVYKFTTCGSKGRLGPSNRSCEIAYNNSTSAVNVINDTYMDGVQVWTVPETGVYTVIASGARGGKGADGMGISKGATSIAVVEMAKNLQLHILVGQEGGDACKKAYEKHDGACQREQYFRTGNALRQLHDLRLLNGGGGGGGGSFVFTGTHEDGFLPLLIGSGGGGLAHGPFKDDRSQHGNGTNDRLPSITAPAFGENPAGAGGGWAPGNYSDEQKYTGASVLEGGAVGGLACYKSRGNIKGAGGFGGGGGGCVAGGGGGGYTGGRAWSNSQTNGEGGWSYLPDHKYLFYSAVYPGSHYGPGAVTIIPAIVGCGCAYLCVAINKLRNAAMCICPMDFRLGADGKSCSYQSAETNKIIILITGSVFTVVIICIIMGLCMYRNYRKRKERKETVQILQNGILSYSMNSRSRNGDMEINPIYDFNGRTVSTDDLPRIAREDLRILRSIGEGAFGIVYRGYYRKSGESKDIRVAIKTLQPKKDMTNIDLKFDDDAAQANPELLAEEKKRKEQKEELESIRSFLAEAVIMSQFKHPNIVKFIGITFEKNYRFIVTEFLAGGDLKEFLRKNRPSVQNKDTIVDLSMKDLLKIALDIAKGCRYLEKLHFIHRDIAARNCLLSSTSRRRVTKIADFGMSRDVYRSDYYKKDGQAMLPIKWMPTEALVDGVFNSKTDIWSFGITLWEILTFGSLPYPGMTNKETMNYVLRGGRLSRPGTCPEPVFKLMCICWRTNPGSRPTFETILKRIRLFMQDPTIINFKQPVVGRQKAPLPYRAIHPEPDEASGSLNGAELRAEIMGGDGEEHQYITPLPADDLFDEENAGLMRNAERFGRRYSDPMLVDDGHNFIEDDDDDDEDDDRDGDAEGVGEEDDGACAFGGEGHKDDDDEMEESDVEEEEEDDDEDDNAEEIFLEADRRRLDKEPNDYLGAQAPNTYPKTVISNGAVPSYNWNRFKETSFISMKEPVSRPPRVEGEVPNYRRRRSFSELEDNRSYPYTVSGQVSYNEAHDGQIRC
ncbi:tyrosine-protein kinase receptor-like [Adelges cooleyi]|uniref:tyrosine-protein kinase receptor-like n=1 Tax=Adelges cooleyi TaxID=133065 RepID=UPI00217F8CAA|nr:tyrosine-protein kinase receptor-like [Adelges cooleyi]